MEQTEKIFNDSQQFLIIEFTAPHSAHYEFIARR